jgi:RNA polymerase sigma factor FliA
MKTDDSVDELWKAYWADGTSLQPLENLVRALAPLVLRTLERISIRLPSNVNAEDLLQAGMVGLCEAIERYDPRQNTAFAAFATPRIRGAVMDELRREDRLPRSSRARVKQVEAEIEAWMQRHGRAPSDAELATALSLTPSELGELMGEAQPFLSLDEVVVPGKDGRELLLKDVISEAVALTPDEAADRQDMLRVLRMAFRSLADREQKVLYLYYYEDLRLAEIAKLFEVTEARVCQIHALTVAKLRSALNAEGYTVNIEVRKTA